MKDRRNSANSYANAIIKDVQNAFVREETIKYSDLSIERVYEFEDGAIVRYEWQSPDLDKTVDIYNHRFSLIKLPKANPDGLAEGVIKVVPFPKR